MSAENLTAREIEMYRLRDMIAGCIDCETACHDMPSGCGCALLAARRIVESAPVFKATQQAESDPAVTLDCAGADATFNDAQGASQSILYKIRERLNGPADAQLYDIRQIVDAALTPPLLDLDADLKEHRSYRDALIEECAKISESYYSGAEAADEIRKLAAQPPAAPVETKMCACLRPGGDPLGTCEECSPPHGAFTLEPLPTDRYAIDDPWCRPATTPVETEPVAYVNGDELANLLDDRTTLIQGTKSGWRRTPLYTKPHFHSSAATEGEPVNISGWKLVPDDPTEAMWQAARTADIHPGDSYSKVWRAMFEAAPDIEDCETTGHATEPQTSGVWQPIETAPKDHFALLVCGPFGPLVAFRDVAWQWWSVPNGERPLHYTPTHWQPLPSSPMTRPHLSRDGDGK